tara:strand:+ start:842 stop:1132 length:291 start_codon:yes stop_codon:yes gene_type:complete
MSSPFQKQFTSKSPLNGAYESGADSMVYVSSAPAFDKLQNQINASTKEAMYGLSENKKDKDKKNKEFKDQLKKGSDSIKEITDNKFILKGYDPKEF